MDAVTTVQKFLTANNIVIQIGKPPVRYLEDGAFLIEKPQLSIFYANPPQQPEAQEKAQPETQGEEVNNESEQSQSEDTNS